MFLEANTAAQRAQKNIINCHFGTKKLRIVTFWYEKRSVVSFFFGKRYKSLLQFLKNVTNSFLIQKSEIKTCENLCTGKLSHGGLRPHLFKILSNKSLGFATTARLTHQGLRPQNLNKKRKYFKPLDCHSKMCT